MRSISWPACVVWSVAIYMVGSVLAVAMVCGTILYSQNDLEMRVERLEDAQCRPCPTPPWIPPNPTGAIGAVE